jgi:hypothetical protein
VLVLEIRIANVDAKVSTKSNQKIVAGKPLQPCLMFFGKAVQCSLLTNIPILVQEHVTLVQKLAKGK